MGLPLQHAQDAHTCARARARACSGAEEKPSKGLEAFSHHKLGRRMRENLTSPHFPRPPPPSPIFLWVRLSHNQTDRPMPSTPQNAFRPFAR